MSEAIEAPEGNNRILNRFVATTVVILSVVTAMNNIKDGNIVQNMQADQASSVDLWNQYQASRLKGQNLEIAGIMLRQNPSPSAQAAAAKSEQGAASYAVYSKQLMGRAKAARADYDRQGRRDDQFDLGEGFLSIAIAVAAIAALIESFWLLSLSWGAAAFGLMFTAAGFAEWPIHPDALVNFLT